MLPSLEEFNVFFCNYKTRTEHQFKVKSHQSCTRQMSCSQCLAMNTRMVLAFLQASLQCFVCCRSPVIVTPSSVPSCTTCSGSPSIQYVWLLFLDQMCLTLRLLMLKYICHFSEYRVIWSRSFWMISQPAVVRVIRNGDFQSWLKDVYTQSMDRALTPVAHYLRQGATRKFSS